MAQGIKQRTCKTEKRKRKKKEIEKREKKRKFKSVKKKKDFSFASHVQTTINGQGPSGVLPFIPYIGMCRPIG